MSTEENSEQTFGQTRELEKAGYTPLRYHGDHVEPAPADKGGEITLKEAAATHRERIAQDAPIIETKFHDADPEKPTAFKDIETAAEALTAGRERYAEDHLKPAQELKDRQERDAIDRLRGQPTESEREQAIIAADYAKAEAARQHSELLQQAHEQIQAHDAQQRSQTLQHAETESRSAVVLTYNSLANNYPELKGLADPQRQIPVIVAALHARNPARAQALVRDLRSFDATATQLKQIKVAQQQHATQEFTRWSQAQDQAFDQRHGKDANHRQVAENVPNVLKQFGISADEYVNLATRPEGQFLRDARVQSLLYEMSKAALARPTMAQLQAKRANPLPPTIDPGASRTVRAPAGAALASQLNSKLKNATGEKALRLAAAIVTQNRKAAR